MNTLTDAQIDFVNLVATVDRAIAREVRAALEAGQTIYQVKERLFNAMATVDAARAA